MKLAVFWVKHIRPVWSATLNRVYAGRRERLPKAISLEKAELIVSNVKWTADKHGDWIKDPELTWGEKKGDCEDISHLVAELIKEFNPERELVDYLCKPSKVGHEVCKFDGGYFDNGRLTYTEETIEEIGERIRGNALKAILVKDPDTKKYGRIR